MVATILLVDDERDLVDLWKEYLQARGHHAVVAHNVRTAREVLADVRTDIILVDFQLPDGSAIDVLAGLGVDPAKVILCSGRGDNLPPDLLAKGHHVLGKPFRLDQLDAAIAAALEGRPRP